MFTYDSNGNTTSETESDGHTQYAWDYENRLTSVILPNDSQGNPGGVVSFRYDPFGRRIQKRGPLGTTNYEYDGVNIVAEHNASGAVAAKYAQGAGIDEPLAMNRQGTTVFYNTDGLGSVVSLTDSTGSATNTYTYSSFGKRNSSSGTIFNPFQYTGREWDQETGLYYYRARYYDPESGRFNSEDLLQFSPTTNLYSYVRNLPTSLIDPSGHIHQAWAEPPYDGRLHDDPGAGLEVLCINKRTRSRDIGWLELSIAVRSAELAKLGRDADAGHIAREAAEIATLARCKECDNEKPPSEPLFDWEAVKQSVKENTKKYRSEYVVIGGAVIVVGAVALAPETGGLSLAALAF